MTRPDETRPRLSVVVCVYNRERQIGDCIESLRASRCTDFEIVAVDDGSSDASVERLEELAARSGPALRIVRHGRNRGISSARNTGIEAALGEVIAFTDSDCTVDGGWTEALIEAFEDPDLVAASGDVEDIAPRNLAERCFAGTSRIGRGALGRAPLVGNNMAFRSAVLRRYGFDPALTYYCDEEDLAWRLRRDGHHPVFLPDAKVFHRHHLDLGSYLRMAYRQGCGSARFWFKQGRWIGRDLLFLLLAILLLPLTLVDPRLGLLSAAALVLHLVALGYAEIALKGKSLLQALPLLPLLFVYSAIKLWGVIRTRVRIAAGREPAIVQSRRGVA